MDAHHTVEDVGICFGQAFAKAIGGKEGINRYGHAYVPLDEALSRVVIDFSGRPGVEYSASYPRQYINDFDVDLIHEFFQGFCNHAMVTLHIDNLKGENGHHIAETIFKAFGRAFRYAKEVDFINNGRLILSYQIEDPSETGLETEVVNQQSFKGPSDKYFSTCQLNL